MHIDERCTSTIRGPIEKYNAGTIPVVQIGVQETPRRLVHPVINVEIYQKNTLLSIHVLYRYIVVKASEKIRFKFLNTFDDHVS